MTSLLEIILIGLVLSSDSFSAAVAMGSRPFTKKDVFKFAISSGLAEGFVALFGALAGTHIVSKFKEIDHWIAFGLLAAVALHMAFEGFQELFSKEEKEEKTEFHSLVKILIVSFATSLDAFGVGIGLGISNKPILPFIFSISFWAFAATIAGLYLAKIISKKFGPAVLLFGAIVLLAMAFQMLKI